MFPRHSPGSLTSRHFTRLFFPERDFSRFAVCVWIKLLRSVFLPVKHLEWDLVKRLICWTTFRLFFSFFLLFEFQTSSTSNLSVASLGSLKGQFTPKIKPWLTGWEIGWKFSHQKTSLQQFYVFIFGWTVTLRIFQLNGLQWKFTVLFLTSSVELRNKWLVIFLLIIMTLCLDYLFVESFSCSFFCYSVRSTAWGQIKQSTMMRGKKRVQNL